MWVLLILVPLQMEVSVPAAGDVERGMRCQRPHNGSLAGECPRENLPWAEGPAVGPAPCTGTGVSVMPGAVRALAVQGERLMDNTVSFCDVKCQNITAWAWRVLELSGAVNSGAGEAFRGHALG